MLSAVDRMGASEFESDASRAVAARAQAMALASRLSEPLFRRAGVRPDSLPLSMLWVPRGALMLRRRIAQRAPDVVLATGPPLAGPIAARIGIGSHVPLVVELRDLWAASPAFDAGGQLLSNVEDWLLRGARRVVACTPEAVSDLRSRHPDLGDRVVEISNGYDPDIASMVANGVNNGAAPGDRPRRVLTLLHSGTLTPARPIAPLVRALADPRLAGSFRLVLHGYLTPGSSAEVDDARRESAVQIDVLAPSPWRDAVGRIAKADIGLITQAHAAGDQTAVASKTYEYLALGKPVLCITDGGATEQLLCRLGAERMCARLDSPESIVETLLRLRDGPIAKPSAAQLEPYDRRSLARRMADLLEDVTRER